MRVLAAMSGGVDSAVAAARAVEAGHEVTGVHLALSRNPQSFRSGARGCCSREDAHDARRAADRLGIPFYVWDLADRFAADVVADFVAEYAAGRTPNPCLRCNERIKFSAVLDRALSLGFDSVCTGHYARVARTPTGTELHRAVDRGKDQSYVLGVLRAEQLSRSLFPLGDTVKTMVRREAARRGLSVSDKPDSHDICFIPDGDTGGFLDAQLGRRGGDILDVEGRKLGEHEGTHRYTVGQRRGLRLEAPAADGQPRYVLGITPVSNTLVVGSRQDLRIRELTGSGVTWTQGPVEAGWTGEVQVRAHGEALSATMTAVGTEIVVELIDPAVGVAPGQTAVFYEGTRVVGSMTIGATGR